MKKIPVRDHVEGEEISDDLIKVANDWLLATVNKCGYCGDVYINGNLLVCSERCDVLAERAVDEARGK